MALYDWHSAYFTQVPTLLMNWRFDSLVGCESMLVTVSIFFKKKFSTFSKAKLCVWMHTYCNIKLIYPTYWAPQRNALVNNPFASSCPKTFLRQRRQSLVVPWEDKGVSARDRGRMIWGYLHELYAVFILHCVGNRLSAAGVISTPEVQMYRACLRLKLEEK